VRRPRLALALGAVAVLTTGCGAAARPRVVNRADHGGRARPRLTTTREHLAPRPSPGRRARSPRRSPSATSTAPGSLGESRPKTGRAVPEAGSKRVTTALRDINARCRALPGAVDRSLLVAASASGSSAGAFAAALFGRASALGTLLHNARLPLIARARLASLSEALATVAEAAGPLSTGEPTSDSAVVQLTSAVNQANEEARLSGLPDCALVQ
jgi:hypothetical protein